MGRFNSGRLPVSDDQKPPENGLKRPIDDQPRDRGRFMPGHRPTAHRKKGSKNKLPRNVAMWMLDAADQLGGKGGGRNFAVQVGRAKPEALFNGLTKLVPAAKAEDSSAAGGYVAPALVICSLQPGDRVSSDGKVVLTEEQARAEWLERHPQFQEELRSQPDPAQPNEAARPDPSRSSLHAPEPAPPPVRQGHAWPQKPSEEELADAVRRRARSRHGPASEWGNTPLAILRRP
jgi:hypothetical protein